MNQQPIIVNGVRVFRPYEVKQIIRSIDKNKYRRIFEACLFSGMRYVELKRLQRHHKWFDPYSGFITLPQISQKKVKQKEKERWVRLNPRGVDKVSIFLEIGKKIPTYVTWRKNLRSWCKNAGLDDDGMSVKVTRKTWESWLVYYYPQNLVNIFKSQGHSEMTSLKHYLGLPFSEQDGKDMEEFVGGFTWIRK